MNAEQNVFSILINNGAIELTPNKINYEGEMNFDVLTCKIHATYQYDENVANNNAVLVLPKQTYQIIDSIEFKVNLIKNNINSNQIEQEKQKQIKEINENASTSWEQLRINLGAMNKGKTYSLDIKMIIISNNINLKTYKTFIPVSNKYIQKSLPGYFSFKIKYNDKMKISNVKVEDSKNQVYLSDFEDNVLTISSITEVPFVILTELENEIKNIVQYIMNDKYYLISAISNFSDLQKNDFFFITDCSGSMEGEPIQYVRECLGFYLHSLPSDCKYNIIRFGSQHECIFQNGIADNNAENLDIAEKLVKSMDADMGGTNLYGPLSEAYKQSQESNKNGRIAQIVILTDGDVDDQRSVFELVENNCSNNVVSTIGIGNSVSKGLIEGIAKRSNGKYDYVSDSANIADKVMNLVSKALELEMKVKEIKIFDNCNKEIFSIRLNNPLTIFEGKLLHFLIKRQDNDKITVSRLQLNGSVNNKEMTSSIGDIHCYYQKVQARSQMLISTSRNLTAMPTTINDIASSQDYNGKFSGSHFIPFTNFLRHKSNEKLFSKTMNDLNKTMSMLSIMSQIEDEDDINDIKSTILGLLIMNTSFQDEKTKWNLIEKKSYEWLKTHSQNIMKNLILQLITSYANPNDDDSSNIIEKMQKMFDPGNSSNEKNEIIIGKFFNKYQIVVKKIE